MVFLFKSSTSTYSHFGERLRKKCYNIFKICVLWNLCNILFVAIYIIFKDRFCRYAQIVSINLFEDFSKTEFIWPGNLTHEEMKFILDGGVLPAQQSYSDFEYPILMSPQRKCNKTPNRSPVDILFLIKSAPDHFDHRSAIRNSWGDEEEFPNIRRIFLVGFNTDLNGKLRREGIQYDDMLQMNFIDAYYNNTLKTTNGLLWASKWCANTAFVVMVDDDYFVATNRLLEYLEAFPETSRKRLYLGQRLSGCCSLAHRSPFRKWYISYTDYPYGSYPPFITAGTIVMTSDVVRDVVTLCPYTKPIIFDDVYIGFIAHKLNIPPLHSMLITMNKVTTSDSLFDTVLATQGYAPSELLQMNRKRRK